MAYIRNLDQVAGFKPHRFSHPVPKMRSQTESAYWQVVRLELISLLKHENPVAYQSTFLPRMDELQSVPVRPLEDFEQQALTKLRTDEDVVIIETGDRIQMVGSLRAAQSCLECHRVQHGELLGAFTYELRPSGSLHP